MPSSYRTLQAGRSRKYAEEIVQQGAPQFKFERFPRHSKVYDRGQFDELRDKYDIGLLKVVGAVVVIGPKDSREILARVQDKWPNLPDRTVQVVMRAVMNLRADGGDERPGAQIEDVIVGRPKHHHGHRKIKLLLADRDDYMLNDRLDLLTGIEEYADVDLTDIKEAEHDFVIHVGKNFSEGARLDDEAIDILMSPDHVDLRIMTPLPHIPDLRAAVAALTES